MQFKPKIYFLLSLVFIVLIIIALMYQLPGVLVAAVLAYLFNPLVNYLSSLSLSRSLSSFLVLIMLLGAVGLIVSIPLPFAIKQLFALLKTWPEILKSIQNAISHIPPEFAQYFQFENLMTENIQSWLLNSSSSGVNFILLLLPSVVNFLIYMVIVPILVFLFLQDSAAIKAWCKSLLPQQNQITIDFFSAVDVQLGNYFRCKLIEIFIVTMVSAICFFIAGLKYSLVLGLVVGVSVFVPLIGAVVATIPVICVAFWQWGFGDEFYLVTFMYFLILILDGHVLVPLLFSNKLNLHPVVVLLAILYFGSVWGFWGVFFAIPLASVINILIVWCVKGDFQCIK